MLLTHFKGLDEPEAVQLDQLSPISAAAPSPTCRHLSELKDLPWADVLDEEICGMLEWVHSLQDLFASRDTDVDLWLWDLDFMLNCAHFHLKHR